MYFRHKDIVWLNKKLLRRYRNPNNNEPVFINERLPPHDRALQKYAVSKNLMTVTNNCAVNVLVDAGNGQKQHIEVRSTKQIDDLADKAIKKRSKPKSSMAFDRSIQNPPPTLLFKGVQRMPKRPLENIDPPMSREELYEKIRACKDNNELDSLLDHLYSKSPVNKNNLNPQETPIATGSFRYNNEFLPSNESDH